MKLITGISSSQFALLQNSSWDDCLYLLLQGFQINLFQILLTLLNIYALPFLLSPIPSTHWWVPAEQSDL